MPDKNLTLKDVDGTTPGRAALITIDLENPDERGGFSHAVFVEGEHNCTDPLNDARGLWKSVEGDWPKHSKAFAHNPRAAYLDWARKMTRFGMSSTPQEYLET